MAGIIYNILRYFFYLVLYLSGVKLASAEERVDIKGLLNYMVFPLILFTILEGTRWGRGADYFAYYKIASGLQVTNAPLFDGFASLICYFDFPPETLFICTSALLAFAVFSYAKLVQYAYVPISFLMLFAILTPAENLVRQMASISFSFFFLSKLFDRSYYSAILFLALAYLTHSSVIFIIPFTVVAFLLSYWSELRDNVFLRNIHWCFLFVYFCSSTLLKDQISSRLELLFDFMPFFHYNDYLTDDYISRAIAVDPKMIRIPETHSLIYYLREYSRNITVILVGFYVIKNVVKEKQMSTVCYVSWFLACCGIIFSSSVPELQLEVIGRLKYYLIFFAYFIEGVIFYHYLYNPTNYTFNYGFKLLIFVTLVMEMLLIFQWRPSSELGLYFTWFKN